MSCMVKPPSPGRGALLLLLAMLRQKLVPNETIEGYELLFVRCRQTEIHTFSRPQSRNNRNGAAFASYSPETWAEVR